MEIKKLILPDIEFIQKSEKSFNDNLNAAKNDELYIETEKAVKKKM